MTQFNFPYTKFHLEFQQKLLNKVKRNIEATKESQFGFGGITFSEIELEIIDHINNFDMQLGEFILKKLNEKE